MSWLRRVSYIGEIVGSATRSLFRNLLRLKRGIYARSSTTTRTQVEMATTQPRCRLMMSLTPQLIISNFAARNDQDDPQATDANPDDGG